MTAVNKTKCLICGEELIQGLEPREYRCDLCGKIFISSNLCKNGHHICSTCAIKEFYDATKSVCIKTKSKNPIGIAEQIMSYPNFTYFGCKHYIVAPMALFTAYKNSGGVSDFEKSLEIIKNAAMSSHTSLCNIGGVCGIPISTGKSLFASSLETIDKERLKVISSKLSVYCMHAITDPEYLGSADCCKRNIYISLIAGTKFIRDYLWIDLELPNVVKCSYCENNPRCNKELCRLYLGKNLIDYC
ncbi:MAG: DUF5714 domain-containing protein [Methanocorpusculum sp.]|nr:DUF5714 domain-containing protein [Methanocorpusculum sp.]